MPTAAHTWSASPPGAPHTPIAPSKAPAASMGTPPGRVRGRPGRLPSELPDGISRVGAREDRQQGDESEGPEPRHWLTGEAGSIRSAVTSLSCCSVRMPLWPKRGMFEHAANASALYTLLYA